VLKLVGNLLESKMSTQHHITHRGLIIITRTADADALLDAYQALPEAEKPKINGVSMVCATYYSAAGGAIQEQMEDKFERFKIISSQDPIHCLIQCAKLGEGYDQPNISVAGICSGITVVSKFAQFSGRSVRKLDHNNVEEQLVPHINRYRDNVAHIVTHEIHDQLRHWKEFTTQQSSGGFNMADEDDDDDENAEVMTTASDEMPITARLPKKPVAEGGRTIKRYALARDQAGQRHILSNEAKTHDGHLEKHGWTFTDVELGSAGAGSSSAAAP